MENSLINLLFNARDAVGHSGRVEITSAEIDGTFIRITIADDGCGMPADVLDHVFEPFFSTKGGGHGIGLGMSTVYGFVTQSGGRIEIQSEVGKGTTVHLDLPRVVC
jgi:signal transduction histidine kinase